MQNDLPLNSLGFAKPPAVTRVVVAMSGGVDSSVVAAMLADARELLAASLRLHDATTASYARQLVRMLSQAMPFLGGAPVAPGTPLARPDQSPAAKAADSATSSRCFVASSRPLSAQIGGRHWRDQARGSRRRRSATPLRRAAPS